MYTWKEVLYIWKVGFPCGSAGKDPPAVRETWVNPWVGKIPWRRERWPTAVFWPGEFHGLYSPWGRRVGHNWATFTLHLKEGRRIRNNSYFPKLQNCQFWVKKKSKNKIVRFCWMKRRTHLNTQYCHGIYNIAAPYPCYGSSLSEQEHIVALDLVTCSLIGNMQVDYSTMT